MPSPNNVAELEAGFNSQVRTVDRNISSNQEVVIIGINQIDAIIAAICPQISSYQAEEINQISNIIIDHILGRHTVGAIIEDRTNADVLEIINGLAIIAKTNQIDTIAGIEAYINGVGTNLSAASICANKNS